MTIPRLLRTVGYIGRIEGAMTAQGCIAWSSDAKAIPRHSVSEPILRFSSGAARLSIPTREMQVRWPKSSHGFLVKWCS